MRATDTLTIPFAAFLQGFLSMGFQLVATRLIAPFYGSTLDVWAFVISTFLLAFSTGSLLGARCSQLPVRRILNAILGIGAVGCFGFALTAFGGHFILEQVDANVPNTQLGTGLVCVLLFFLPVVALSCLLPIFTEVLVRNGRRGGVSTGVVYGFSTLGNIVGVMTTAFYLIPHLHTSSILQAWVLAAMICFSLFYAAIQKMIALL